MPRSLLAIALVCGMAATALPAAAEPEPDPSAVDAARVDFAEGQAHFRSKRWADALKSFERSYAQVPSPNAQLMIGRCLRELGRLSEAATAFSSAESEARRRLKNGESKYADTAEAALAEGSAVRASLGTLKIHVSRPPSADRDNRRTGVDAAHANGPTLTVDKKTVALSPSGEATLLREPGPVQVTVRGEDGVEQRQTATVVANNTAEMEFVVAEGKSAPTLATKPVPRRDEPTPEKGGFPGWFLPSIIATGALTVVGAGVGVGFGVTSQAQFDDLVSRCGPDRCTSAQDRAQADTGRHNQTIANVGFGLAVVGLVATGVVLFLGLTSDHRTGKL